MAPASMVYCFTGSLPSTGRPSRTEEEWSTYLVVCPRNPLFFPRDDGRVIMDLDLLRAILSVQRLLGAEQLTGFADRASLAETT